MGDSNLDWGQDLERLGRYVRGHDIEDLHLAYWGPTAPETLGLREARPLAPGQRTTGWIAISVSFLQNIVAFPEGDYLWLSSHVPTARIGKSILLYHIDDDE